MSYSYYSMKPNEKMFRHTSVTYTGDYTYRDYASKMQGPNADAWKRIQDRFGEDTQQAILRGIAVAGVGISDWEASWNKMCFGVRPFDTMAKDYLERKIDLNWTYFGDKFAKEMYLDVHYPPLCPEWLYPYAYIQRDYLSDLSRYWNNIHDDYYKPWATTQLGKDSPEIARLKRLGEEARREIDQVANHGSQHLKR